MLQRSDDETHTNDDDRGFKMSSFEQRRSLSSYVSQAYHADFGSPATQLDKLQLKKEVQRKSVRCPALFTRSPQFTPSGRVPVS